ncbi:hypothetical protein [Brachybacterium avium]|uniref:hypothetical protein n=1 Tax=Brachybacterium avium TaxID=2017485 RepID=UPI0015B14670|nr:hypothetical protein [Brachybacterium avium]
MEPFLSSAGPGSTTAAEPLSPDAGGAELDRLSSIGLCAAWSRHAAELAVPMGTALQRWEETPPTRVLVAEGYLKRLLPGRYVPPDLLGTAVQRALALGCALGSQLQSHHVIAGPSAAWVLLGGEPPAPAELLSSAHRGELAGVVLRTARLRPEEVETIGGTPITIPVRTAMDLLRFTPASVATPLLQGLAAHGHLRTHEVRHQLQQMHRHPGVQSARQRLEEVLGGQREVSWDGAPTGLPSAVTR